ncbi:MAG: DsbE family thiol:disulfide interchange protein [Legionellaceae bacterium]|nr:DsbE family thiol:disulfide interchange protein [Legionellaceae bacterium]
MIFSKGGSCFKKSLPAVGILALCVLFAFGLTRNPHQLPSTLLHKSMADFTLPLLGSDKVLDSQTLKGKMLVLNVFSSWCETCLVENHFLMQLAKQGVFMVGLPYQDNPRNALQWLHRYGSPYSVVVEDKQSQLSINLGVYGVPETYLIDKDGRILYRHVGPLDEQVWKTKFLPYY